MEYYKSNISGIVYKRDDNNWWRYRGSEWKPIKKHAFWQFQFIACEKITEEEANSLFGSQK